jgi:hypothetical protein
MESGATRMIKEKYLRDYVIEEVCMSAWGRWSQYKSEKLRLNDFSKQTCETEMKLFHEILPKVMEAYLGGESL